MRGPAAARSSDGGRAVFFNEKNNMAQSTDNVVMHGMKGLIGRMLVFRQKGDKTIVSKRPKRSGIISPGQKVINDKFQLAAVYALGVLADAPTKAAYDLVLGPNQSAYNLAIADYFIAPTVNDVDANAYTGAVGSKIKVNATDDFMVKTVKVSITHPDGTLVEEGLAVQEGNGPHWIYTATAANASIGGNKVKATATDLPANVTVKEITLP
jgi:hypothetical protein